MVYAVKLAERCALVRSARSPHPLRASAAVASEGYLGRPPPSVTVCFDGGGWTIPYLIGAVDGAGLGDRDDVAYAGVSSGACVALAAALGVPMRSLMDDCVAWARVCRPVPALTVNAVRSICRRRVEALPSRAELLARVDGRLAIGVSAPPAPPSSGSSRSRLRLPLESRVVSRFRDGAHVVSVVTASCTVPYVNAPPPSFAPEPERRLGYLDGVLTARFFPPPWGGPVVRVSPTRGRACADLACPADTSLLDSIVPLDEDGLEALFELGRRDGPRLASLISFRDGGKPPPEKK